MSLERWNDKDTYYVQNNNPQEEILRKIGRGSHLETCGPTAAIMGLAARGDNIDIETPGGYKPQPEGLLANWFHDPRNYETMKNARPNINPENYMGNRVPQYYPSAIEDVFGVKCKFVFKHLDVKFFQECIDNGSAIMCCLKNPGHYITVVHIDDGKIVYNDPWPGNFWPKRLSGTSGFNRVIDPSDLENFQDFAVIIGVK